LRMGLLTVPRELSAAFLQRGRAACGASFLIPNRSLTLGLRRAAYCRVAGRPNCGVRHAEGQLVAARLNSDTTQSEPGAGDQWRCFRAAHRGSSPRRCFLLALRSARIPLPTPICPGCINLDTSSVVTGLKLLYRTEGIGGWFRGVGPRFVWTSVQSGCMLLLYQTILRQLEVLSLKMEDEL
jgi:hypothetical protein